MSQHLAGQTEVRTRDNQIVDDRLPARDTSTIGHGNLYSRPNYLGSIPHLLLGGSLVTTAWRVFGFRIERLLPAMGYVE
jgi:hypothetical protein